MVMSGPCRLRRGQVARFWAIANSRTTEAGLCQSTRREIFAAGAIDAAFRRGLKRGQTAQEKTGTAYFEKKKTHGCCPEGIEFSTSPYKGVLYQ